MAKKVTSNFLSPENCNKAMCKTCIFQTNGQAIQLSVGRIDEIKSYLATGESSHVCHTTNKTCYGALSFQANVFKALGIITENTVNCLLETAAKHLNKS